MSGSARLEVADSAAIADGGSATFMYRDEYGLSCDGFVIRFEGRLRAFKNQCPHQPLSLDYGDGEFFDEDGRLLVCRNHGAVFEPATGRCVDGPCYGAVMRSLRVEEQDGKVFVTIPPESEARDLV